MNSYVQGILHSEQMSLFINDYSKAILYRNMIAIVQSSSSSSLDSTKTEHDHIRTLKQVQNDDIISHQEN